MASTVAACPDSSGSQALHRSVSMATIITTNQKLILFLIYCDPGIRDIYTMVKVYDRANFPSNISANLKPLLDNKLIFVSETFDNGTASKYGITESGKKYLDQTFDTEEVINYVKTMENPDQLLRITRSYITKEIALRGKTGL